MMLKQTFLSIALPATLLTGSTLIQAQNKQPNVIVILTDDQGSIDMNCYGAKDLTTPHMDRLAETGVKFTQFYVAAPVCSPSRASMLTGQNPHAAGLPGNASSHQGHTGMPTEKITLAEVMKDAGYATAHIGKWHIGYTPETMPLGQGFDYSFGHMGGCIDNYSHFFYWNGPNRHDLWENGQEVWHDGEYFGQLMADKADAFIEAHQDDPFFMYYAINMPHYPLQPTAKWRDHYKDLEMPRRDYAAFISTMDDYIGQLLSTLERLGLRENTIVVLQSDHGHSTEDRTFGGGGDAGPFRGCKFTLFEGGIRVPSIISYPKAIPQNVTRHQMAFNVDWLPTLADYCGIDKLPENLDGKSLKKVIEKGKASPHEIFRWKSGASWAVRQGDWKLIGYPQDPIHPELLNPDTDQLFLVNLKQDSTEMTNLAASYPEKTEALKQAYLRWEHANEEDIPTKRLQLKHKAIGQSIELKTTPHPKYSAGGATALIDGETGTRFFNDGFWMGFNGNDLEAMIDFHKMENFNQVSVGMVQDAESWVFFPKSIEVSWSEDGTSFSKPLIRKIEPLESLGRKSTQRITLQQEDMHGRFMKVVVKNSGVCPDWHVAKGEKAWLFIDEISIN